LGGAEFLRALRESLQGNRREQPSLKDLEDRPDWSAVVQAVEAVKGAPWASFRDRHGDWGRDLALYLGRRVCGLSLGHLAAAAGGLDYATAGVAISRFAGRVRREPELERVVSEVRSRLAMRQM
jgi:hypothetical protein